MIKLQYKDTNGYFITEQEKKVFQKLMLFFMENGGQVNLNDD